MSADASDAARAPDAATVFARAAAADARADARLATAIDDFFLAEDDRLDDRTRAGVSTAVAAIVVAAQRAVGGHAARLIAANGLTVGDTAAPLLPRLIGAGLLRDPAFMGEVLAQVRLAQLAAALRANRQPGSSAGLLARLGECRDGVVAAAAGAYLLAENRQRSAPDGIGVDLPAALHHRVSWWVAAALRERLAGDDAARPIVDGALAEAALRSIGAHDDSERLEVVAARLAGAIDARPEELAELLVDALAEGHATLFVAVVAHARSIDAAEARDLVLDPDGDRLWLALRAHGLDRTTIARIGLLLAEADNRRDIERFADEIDAIAAIPADAARATLAPLALHRDFRLALRTLARSAAR